MKLRGLLSCDLSQRQGRRDRNRNLRTRLTGSRTERSRRVIEICRRHDDDCRHAVVTVDFSSASGGDAGRH